MGAVDRVLGREALGALETSGTDRYYFGVVEKLQSCDELGRDAPGSRAAPTNWPILAHGSHVRSTWNPPNGTAPITIAITAFENGHPRSSYQRTTASTYSKYSTP